MKEGVKMRNRCKHALDRLKCSSFMKSALLPGEDADEFADFADQIFLELLPLGPSEEAYVLRIAKLRWRRSRAFRTRPELLSFMEKFIIKWEMKGRGDEEVLAEIARVEQERREELKQCNEAGNPESDPEAMNSREAAAELDTQINDAMKHLAELKKMKHRTGLV